MATYGVATSSSNYRGHPAYGAVNQPYVIDAVVQLSSAYASADVLQVLAVPANTVVLTAGIECISANSASGSGTLSLGTSAGVGRFVSAQQASAAGQLTQAVLGSTTANSLVLGTLDTLDVVINTATNTAKIRVWAVLADLSRPETSAVLTLSSATTV